MMPDTVDDLLELVRDLMAKMTTNCAVEETCLLPRDSQKKHTIVVSNYLVWIVFKFDIAKF
jgi:hypothetical protein